MYTEWYATEFFSQYEPFQSWVNGETVQSINVYDAWVLLLNLSTTHDAHITATFFYADEPPQDFAFTLKAGRQGRLHLQDDVDNLGTGNLPPGCNPRKRFGVRMVSDQPIVVQATAGDRIGAERITNSMATYLFHPGPLGEAEKQWVYVDCLYLVSEKFPLEEREWLTILNPNKTPASCTLTFIPGGDVEVGGKAATPFKEDVPVVQHRVSVPAERILPLLISDLAGVIANQPYAARVTSDVPVTVQGIRHIFERGKYTFSRCWAVLDALPIAPM
ncbi:MAG: hypothetical protein HPY45_14890 [Anaerolineae bacterium]|nr:hypothetical protein [Anaerolineae bacterium]